MNGERKNLQAEIARCTLCVTQFPRLRVNCPPGTIYPNNVQPPQHVRILFVGVAPPKRGRHFYADAGDNLRLGLFSVLTALGLQCRDLQDFLGHGFFLVHTAKCAIAGTTEPHLPVSLYCSSHHLRREIEQLQPDAVCWLSKIVAYKVCLALRNEWENKKEIPFGEVTEVGINGKNVLFLPTTWPGRGWQR